MPDRITDPPPADVADQLQVLSGALDRVIPAKQPGRNLLIGTWNVRGFDRLTPRWRSAVGDSPIRDLSNLLCIIEVVRRFDVIAVQEVRRSAQAFLAMLQVLGEGWAFLVTDVTRGRQGNNERLAFVFDRQRVRPSGLACELVVAAEDAGIPEPTLQGQFARTPYAVSFAADQAVFTLITLHVIYGQGPADRTAELQQIADWLAEWATQGDAWGTNLIALGDFNIDRRNDPLYQAFHRAASTSRPQPRAPHHLRQPRPAAPPDHRHFYDQVAWFVDTPGVPALTLQYENAGMFNFAGGLIPAANTLQLSWRISDHFPLWVEFRLPP
jgi:endonuclease/exonuclease/phosphatase family metal-dependent hydrolase